MPAGDGVVSWFRRKPKTSPEQWFVEVVFETPTEAVRRLSAPMSERAATAFAAEMNESNMRLIEALRGIHFRFRAVKEES